MSNVFTKDPNAELDYGFDWSDWLADGETISSSSWEVDSGITVVSSSASTTRTVVWLSGGTVGETYKATNSIVTSVGRKDDRTLYVYIEER